MAATTIFKEEQRQGQRPIATVALDDAMEKG